MRICLICEGSYPYVAGGVSGWVQMLTNHFTEHEFVIWSIATTEEEMKDYKYVLPPNVVEVKTLYIGSVGFGDRFRKVRLTETERKLLQKLVTGEAAGIDWRETLRLINRYRENLIDLLMGEDFYRICLEEYERQDSKKVFSQFLWSFRGMYLPVMYILSDEIPKADIYHAVSTGYAGILGSCASFAEEKPLLLSEHGIYTREREEDIIRSKWVDGDFKNTWIEFFKKLSLISYKQAAYVTSLFEMNRALQVELGCPEETIHIIPNGVDPEEFETLTSRGLFDHGCFQIGAVLRIVPIKDIKTMLLAFSLVVEKEPGAQLHILGNYDEDPEYYHECRGLVEDLGIPGVTFHGQVDVREYLPELDLLLLSSISEGQPLAVLEGMAAGVPYVCTNVGDCKGLLYGEFPEDTFGPAGIVVPAMDAERMARAILECIRDRKKLKNMGEAGKKRVRAYYRKDAFLEQYRQVYDQLGGEYHGGHRV